MKRYNFSVYNEDGTHQEIAFSVEEGITWDTVLENFICFLELESYVGVRERVKYTRPGESNK